MICPHISRHISQKRLDLRQLSLCGAAYMLTKLISVYFCAFSHK
jgi:hypothetical protein